MKRLSQLVSAAMMIALLVAACTRSDPEKELRSAITAMAHAIEQQRVSDAIDAVSDDFTRESGAFGKQDVRRLLAGAMLRNEKIALATAITGVRVEGERAHVTLRVVATGGAGGFPERGQTWEFDSVWRRESGRWKVFNAEWREGF